MTFNRVRIRYMKMDKNNAMDCMLITSIIEISDDASQFDMNKISNDLYEQWNTNGIIYDDSHAYILIPP